MNFIIRSKEIYGNKYDYSLVEYKNIKTKVKIICKEHGIFEQRPDYHLNGIGCKLCKDEEKEKIFFDKITKLVDNKYDTSLVEYVRYGDKIKLICQEHGIFEKRIDRVKFGCPKCKITDINNKQRKSLVDVIKDFKSTHKDKYDYSLVKYINTYTPIKIICKKHGVFKQIPRDHIRGQGCPKCKESKGEEQILNYLNEEKIKYVKQKQFKECLSVKNYLLKFDFYLPDYNLCIEYDGLQHYKPIKHWGGDKGLNERKQNDQLKNKYCLDNGIKICRILYNDDISNILNKLFKNS